MRSVFISDLHLDEQRPGTTALLVDFLASGAAAADRLYVLGDLFEAWIGDDHETKLSRKVANAFSRLSDGGVPIAFIHGNRDFLVGDRYASRCGMQILPDMTIIDLDGTPTLIGHGDTLCTDDTEYQAIRAMVRNPAWIGSFLSKSVGERLEFAADAREQSRAHTSSLSYSIMDVNEGAVEAAMKTARAEDLIHGHTHRPAEHHLVVSSKPARRFVLADWHDTGACLIHESGQYYTQPVA